jgi:hypothetical protein
MPFERLGQEPLSGSQIAPFAEPELDRVTNAGRYTKPAGQSGSANLTRLTSASITAIR